MDKRVIKVHLGQQKNYTLDIELFDNRVANTIWKMIHTATDIDFVSRTEFYEFGKTKEEVEQDLNTAINHLKRLKPDSFTHDFDLNRLHENFPDLIHTETNPEVKHWLTMFNYHLHHLEGKTSGGRRRFLFCSNIQSEDLREEDYDLFTPSKETNTVYMNYPHVGKNILELVNDNDVEVPKEHIIPTSIIKADLLFHLDENRWLGKEPQLIDYTNNWIKQIEHKLPYPIGDKRLALGHIPIGKILEPDINRITKHQYIYDIETL
jgi:hypothetical protein